MSRLPLCLFLLVLAGCSFPARQATIQPEARPAGHAPQRNLKEEEVRFLQAMTEWFEGEDAALRRIAETQDTAPWNERARELLDAMAERHQHREEVVRQRQDLQTCQRANDGLKSDNRRLHKDLEELKRILVDMENRGR